MADTPDERLLKATAWLRQQRATKTKGRLASAGEAIDRFLARAGIAKRVAQAGVIEEWPQLVGPQIAAVTRAESVYPDGSSGSWWRPRMGQRAEPDDPADHGPAQQPAGGKDPGNSLDCHRSIQIRTVASTCASSTQCRQMIRPRTETTTAPTPSRSSRAWRRFASGPACTSGRPARTGCTTWSTRWSTTRSTRRWPDTATRSTSPSTRTTRSRSWTTAAASRWTSIRPRRCPASRWP